MDELEAILSQHNNRQITKDNVDDILYVNSKTRLHVLMEQSIIDSHIKSIIFSLIRIGANVNVQNDQKQTPLMLASMAKRFMGCDLLEECLKTTDFHITDQNGYTILHFFSKYCIDPSATKIILQKCNSSETKSFNYDFLIMARNNNQETPLHLARHESIVDELLSIYQELTFSYDKDNHSELYSSVSRNKVNIAKRLVEKQFTVPADITDVINIAIEKRNDSVIEKVLMYGKECISTEHILTAIRCGKLPQLLRKCQDLDNIGEIIRGSKSQCPILVCVKYENARRDFSLLRRYLKDVNWLEMTDDHGNNIAHYCCQYNQCEILGEVLKVQQDILVQPNDFKLYPLAFVIINDTSEFLQKAGIDSWFSKPSDGLSNINMATDTMDLLHFNLINYRSKFAVLQSLLAADFPFKPDPSGKYPVHQACIKDCNKDTLKKILDHDQENLNTKDKLGCTPLDYAIIATSLDLVTYLVEEKHARTGIDTNKIVQWFKYKQWEDDANVEDILDLLQITCPDTIDKEAAQEIELIHMRLKEGITAEDLSYFAPLPSAPSHLKYDIFNVLLFCEDMELFSDLEREEHEAVLIRYHTIQTNLVSLDDAPYFTTLRNRKLVIVASQISDSLVDMLTVFSEVTDPNAQDLYQTEPKIISTDYKSEVTVISDLDQIKCNIRDKMAYECFLSSGEGQWEDPDTQSLDIAKDKLNIAEADEEDLLRKLDKYQTTGFYFQHTLFRDNKRSCCYFRDFYTTKQSTSVTEDHALNTLLTQLNFCTKYFDKAGKSGFKVTRFSSEPVPTAAHNAVYLRVSSVQRDKAVNVSRLAAPMFYTRLVTAYLLLPTPTPNTLLFVQPHIQLRVGYNSAGLVQFHLHATNAAEIGQHVFTHLFNLVWEVAGRLERLCHVRVQLAARCTNNVQHHHFQYASEIPGALTGQNPVEKVDLRSFFKHDEDPISECKLDLGTIERLRYTEPLKGNTPLCLVLESFSSAVTETNRDKVIALLGVKDDAALYTGTDVKEILLRYINMRDPHIRRVFRDTAFNGRDRQRICDEIGLDVSETYRRMENCWLKNKIDLFILGLSVLVCAVVLIVIEVAGWDVDKLGIGGICTLPFIAVWVKRIVNSCSRDKARYQNIPPAPDPEA